MANYQKVGNQRKGWMKLWVYLGGIFDARGARGAKDCKVGVAWNMHNRTQNNPLFSVFLHLNSTYFYYISEINQL
jgi:hypothetical protein